MLLATFIGVVPGTHCSRSWRRSDAVMPDPLGVGLLHGGLLHVFALGKDLFHGCYAVSTNCRQANITPERPAW